MHRTRQPSAWFIPIVLGSLLGMTAAGQAGSTDWPQFMRNPQHTGDASEEALKLPLGLATAVQLDDAVTTSPAVVSGKVYVVDQMGTAYAIDPVANRIDWKASPDGEQAMGGNTSSPAVYRGRMIFATTAGKLHILDVKDGRTITSVDLGWPVTGAVTVANEHIYLQTLGAVVHCFDLDGKEIWRWDHYRNYKDPNPPKSAQGFPGSFQDPHFGGGEVAVAGKKLVVNIGWDLFQLEDAGESAKLVWCNRAIVGKDGGIPMGASISGDWVYVGYPSTDQFGGCMRIRLSDGSFDRKADFRSTSYPGYNWAVHNTQAVRGSTVFVPTHYMGMHAFDYGNRRQLWNARTDNTLDQQRFTPCIASPALTKEHCVFGTIRGELYVVAIDSNGQWPNFKPAPWKFQTPFGKPIASSPVVADGCIYFGCDDGFLYGLAPDGRLPPPGKMKPLHEVRTRVVPATGKRYGVPVASINQGNTNCVDDPDLRPPFRLRWASKPFDLRVQVCTDEDSLYFTSEAGTIAALEQSTGRIRWRYRLNGPVDGWKQMLLHGRRLYLTRSTAGKQRPIDAGGPSLCCLDADTGAMIWQQPWGTSQGTCRGAPVLVGDVVAGFTVTGDPPRPHAQAFDAATGKPLWKHELPGDVKSTAGGACVLDGVMFFSCGQTWGNGPGSTIAVEPASGKVLWTSAEYHTHGYGRPAAQDGRLYLGGQSGAPMYCVDAKDGKLIWQEKISYSHHPALGADYFITRGYGGHGVVRDLATARVLKVKNRELLGGCPDHACSPVLLSTARLSFAVSSSGLYVRDLSSGEIIWQSLGFAPRACTNPVPAGGRLFFSPNANNMLYCFEPMRKEKE